MFSYASPIENGCFHAPENGVIVEVVYGGPLVTPILLELISHE